MVKVDIPISQIKGFIRLISALIGLALLILSCIGFDYLGKQNKQDFEAQTSFGCMCFLGVIFGFLLALGETKVELFFFFFGFMRYRIGRAVLFIISGVMTALIGKNMNDKCKCTSFGILIAEGVACIGMGGAQLFSIPFFGNNSAPVSKNTTVKNDRSKAPANTTVPAAVPIATSMPVAMRSPPFELTVPADATESVQVPKKDEGDSNLPSWMRV
jgi:hypothetical protein